MPFPIEQRTCQTDLELVLEEGDGTIDGVFRYNADLFDRATIERMADHWQTLVAGLVDDPDRRLSELPWLTEAERHQVLGGWSRGALEPVPPGLCLHHLVEQQAARTPEAVAVSAGERSIRYGELDAWAGRIANRLGRRGRSGSLVALCLPRSPEMVAAILGTLKAGAAFVPLDPDAPAERLRIILNETRTAAILTLGPLAERLPRSGAEVIALDQPESISDTEVAWDAEGTGALAARPEDLAYVIFTSGSTGRPKGVMIEHRAIVNTLLWRRRALEVRPDDRVLMAIPYVFDPSVCVIISTLAAGAVLVLADPGEERDPGGLLERIARQGVTVLQVPLAVLRLMLDGPFAESCRGGALGRLRRRTDAAGPARPALRGPGRGPAQPLRPDRGRGRGDMVDLPPPRSPAESSRSGGRSRARGPTCWTATGGHSPRGSPASSISAARGSRAAT